MVFLGICIHVVAQDLQVVKIPIISYMISDARFMSCVLSKAR